MESQEALAIEIDKAKIQKVMNIYGTKTERETINQILDDIIYVEKMKTASEEEGKHRKEESDTLHESQQGSLHLQRDKVAQPPSLLLNIIKFTHFSNGFIGENLTLEEYTNLSEEEKFQLQCTLLEANREWIHRKFQQIDAAWIMVVDGEVVASSSDIDKYPQESDVLKVCQQKGKFPFIFDDERRLLIEESSSPWSPTVYANDTYPTAWIEVSSAGSSLNLVADLDTGAMEIFVGLRKLQSAGLIQLLPTDVPSRGFHLNQTYRRFRRRLSIGLVAEDGTVRSSSFSVVCVQDWSNSPFVAINPNRGADFPICVLCSSSLIR